jgi:hypothetical protein
MLLKGNKKLGKSIYHFPLPAIQTCTPSKWCKKHCYALHGIYVIHKKMIDKCHQRNYFTTMEDSFIQDISFEISKKKIKYVRIHTSGDFYDNRYVWKWYQIALYHPETKFLAFTKRIDLAGPLQEFAKLPNVSIKESLDPTIANPGIEGVPKAYIQGTPGENGHICSGYCSECFECWNKNTNIILPAH